MLAATIHSFCSCPIPDTRPFFWHSGGMKRRTSFRTVLGCLVATIIGRCVAFGEVTKFYWPGRWSEDKLRQHLATDSKHLFDPAKLSDLTFQDCLDLHDWHHCEIGHLSRTPWPEGKQIPDTPEGRGPTNKPTNEPWDEYLKRRNRHQQAPAPAPQPTVPSPSPKVDFNREIEVPSGKRTVRPITPLGD